MALDGILMEKNLSSGNGLSNVEQQLLEAVRHGDLENVKLLVTQLTDLSFEDKRKRTPLDVAIEVGRYDIVEELKDKLLKGCYAKLKELPSASIESSSEQKSLSFVAATFSGNYQIELEPDDINNILKMQHINDKGMFKAVDFEQLESVLKPYKSECKSARGTFIINLGELEWGTLILTRNKNGELEALYTDSSSYEKSVSQHRRVESVLKKTLDIECKGLTLSKVKVNKFDTGVFALRNAQIIHSDFGKLLTLEENLNQPYDSTADRKLYANMLNEKKRTENKMEKTLGHLKALNSNVVNTAQFTYKNANILVLFLETFALQDTYPTIFNTNNTERNELEKRLREIKKKYFTQFYPGKDKEKNKEKEMDKEKDKDKEKKKNKEKDKEEPIDLINKVRTTILHSTAVLQPELFTNFKPESVNVSQFFKRLELFTKNVLERIDGKVNTESISINSFLDITPPKEQKEEEENFLSLLFDFIKNTYLIKEKSFKDLQKMLFDVTVNIIPILDNRREKIYELSSLRNKLIHDFQEHENNISRLMEFKGKIWKFKSLLFKYCYSQIIYGVIQELNGNQYLPFKKLKKNFKSKIKEFKAFEDLKPESVAQDNVQNTFEYIFSQSLFPEKDGDITDLVGQYLRYMVGIDREDIDDKEDIDNEEEIEISRRRRDLGDVERREIFEDFVRLKEDKNLYEYKKNKLKVKLFKYGIEESYVDEVMKLNPEGNQPLNKIKEKITSIIRSLKSLLDSKELQNYNFTSQVIFQLYDHYIMEEKTFSLKENQDLLPTNNLPRQVKGFIKKQLNNLPKDEILVVPYGEGNIKVSSNKLVRNILRTFYTSYNLYQIKFNNPEEAFNDTTFLNYLVDKYVLRTSDKDMFQFRDSNFICVVIKKLINIEYTAPFIACLLAKVRNRKAIETSDLEKLIKTLSSKEEYMEHLGNLLCVNIEEEEDDTNLYKMFCNVVLQQHNFNVKTLRVILDNDKHAKEILAVLSKRIDSSNGTDTGPVDLTKKVLDLLNRMSLESIYKGRYEEAQRILEGQLKLELECTHKLLLDRKLLTEDDDLIVDFKLYLAKLKNALGVEKRNLHKFEEAEMLLEEALKVLDEELTKFKRMDSTHSPKYFLTMSLKGYSLTLLKRYDESYDTFSNLYKIIISFINPFFFLFSSKKKHRSFTGDSKFIYALIKKSKNYQKILSSSTECKNYLNIFSIKYFIAFNKQMQGLLKSNILVDEALKDYNEALGLYKEILVFQKDNEVETKFILATIKNITRVSVYISQLNLLEHNTSLARNLYVLQEQTKFLKKIRELFGDYHLDVGKTVNYIVVTLRRIAFSQKELIQHYKALEIFIDVCNILKVILGENHDVTLETEKDIAYSYIRIHQFEDALAIYQQVWEIQKNMLGENHNNTLKTKKDIAYTYIRINQFNKALEIFQRVWEIQKVILGENHNDTLETEKDIASTYIRIFQFNKALEIFQRVWEIQKNMLGENHKNTLTTKKDIAYTCNKMGQVNDSLKIFQQVWEIQKDMLGENHNDTLETEKDIEFTRNKKVNFKVGVSEINESDGEFQSYMLSENPNNTLETERDIAFICDKMGQVNDGLKIFQQVWEIQKEKLGENHNNTLETVRDIAFTRNKMGEVNDGLKIYQQVWEIQKEKLGENLNNTLKTVRDIAFTCNKMGQVNNDGLKIFQQVWKIQKDMLGENLNNTLETVRDIAFTCNKMGQVNDGLKIFQQVWEIQKDMLGENHNNTLVTVRDIAFTYNTMGQFKDALKFYQHDWNILTNQGVSW